MQRSVRFALAGILILAGQQFQAADAAGIEGGARAYGQMQVGTEQPDAGDIQPRWYPQFSVQFNESTKILFRLHTKGLWAYDFPSRKEATVRDNGRGDRYCGSVHPFTDTPCTHLVNGGMRYLLFPALHACCACCSVQAGCGVLADTWLDSAAYQGEVQIRDQTAHKWLIPGLQKNYWYATADAAQLPLELDQLPNDKQALDPSTFKPRAPPAEAFNIPEYCYGQHAPRAAAAAEAEAAEAAGMGSVALPGQDKAEGSGAVGSGDSLPSTAHYQWHDPVRLPQGDIPRCPLISTCSIA